MSLTEEQIAEIRTRVASDHKIRVMDENSARRVNEIIFDRAALLSALEAANKRADEAEALVRMLEDAETVEIMQTLRARMVESKLRYNTLLDALADMIKQ